MAATAPSQVLVPPQLYPPLLRRLQEKSCQFHAARAPHIAAPRAHSRVWSTVTNTAIVLSVAVAVVSHWWSQEVDMLVQQVLASRPLLQSVVRLIVALHRALVWLLQTAGAGVWCCFRASLRGEPAPPPYA